MEIGAECVRSHAVSVIKPRNTSARMLTRDLGVLLSFLRAPFPKAEVHYLSQNELIKSLVCGCCCGSM